MRKKVSWQIEAGRINDGVASGPGDPCGRFKVVCPITHGELRIIAGNSELCVEFNEEPLDHVSVSLQKRCPTWAEMCWVKEQFFEDEELVIQYHPPKSKYINAHPNVLHLWRPRDIAIPLPPPHMV